MQNVTPMLPAYCHPTTVYCLSQPEAYAERLRAWMAPHGRVKIFQDVHHLQQSILQSMSHDFLEPHLEPDCQHFGEAHLRIDIARILELAHDTKRWERVAVIMLDQSASNNVLTLAKHIKAQAPVFIILLVDALPPECLIQAFNHQYIDRVIDKNDPKHLSVLRSTFRQLQEQWFLRHTHTTMQVLTSNPNHPLKDPAMTALFRQICVENRMIEFYILDESGSFVLFSVSGEISCLLVRSAEDQQIYAELAEDSPHRQRLIQTRQKIACFSKPGGGGIEASQYWKLYDATRLNEGIDYCLVKKASFLSSD